LGDIVEAEFHFDRYNPKLSPKQHKETTNSGAGILKDLGPHLIDQAYLFGFLLLWVISESLVKIL
jgi:predicted dehydrogenase